MPFHARSSLSERFGQSAFDSPGGFHLEAIIYAVGGVGGVVGGGGGVVVAVAVAVAMRLYEVVKLS